MKNIILKLFVFLSHIPWCIMYGISDILYYPLYYIIRYRRKTTRKNLINSFPDKDLHEIKKIEKKFYIHFCDLFAETIKTLSISNEEIKERVVFTNPEVLNSYLKEGKNIVTIGGHFGNWEWLTSFSLWAEPGSKVLPLYKPLHNKTFDELMLLIRRHFGADPMHKKEMLRKLVTFRREGIKTIVAFIGDQRPQRHNAHMWTRFLNQETAVFPGAEKISELFKAIPLYVWTTQEKRGYYRITFYEIDKNPLELEFGEMTRKHTELLEKNIIASPELWLWSHSRWKYKHVQE